MLAALAACTSVRSHPFIANLYESVLGCVDHATAVDVADGPPVDTVCDAACAIQPSEGGLYVTTQCPPYPIGWDFSGTNPSCPAALAAHARQDFCEDGGSTNPLDASDGAPPVDAPADAPDGG